MLSKNCIPGTIEHGMDNACLGHAGAHLMNKNRGVCGNTRDRAVKRRSTGSRQATLIGESVGCACGRARRGDGCTGARCLRLGISISRKYAARCAQRDGQHG